MVMQDQPVLVNGELNEEDENVLENPDLQTLARHQRNQALKTKAASGYVESSAQQKRILP